MDYPPIADHGLIGDLQTAALVSTDGTVDWMCLPRFDRLIRKVTGIRGRVPLVARVEPRFDYGRASHRVLTRDNGVVFDGNRWLAVSTRPSTTGDAGWTPEPTGADGARLSSGRR